MSMSEREATELAIRVARYTGMHDYVMTPNFEPHPWVVMALLIAANAGDWRLFLDGMEKGKTEKALVMPMLAGDWNVGDPGKFQQEFPLPSQDAIDASRYRHWRADYRTMFAISGKWQLSFNPVKAPMPMWPQDVTERAVDRALDESIARNGQ